MQAHCKEARLFQLKTPAGPPSFAGQAWWCVQLAGRPGGAVYPGNRSKDAPSPCWCVYQGGVRAAERLATETLRCQTAPPPQAADDKTWIKRQKAAFPDSLSGIATTLLATYPVEAAAAPPQGETRGPFLGVWGGDRTEPRP